MSNPMYHLIKTKEGPLIRVYVNWDDVDPAFINVNIARRLTEPPDQRVACSHTITVYFNPLPWEKIRQAISQFAMDHKLENVDEEQAWKDVSSSLETFLSSPPTPTYPDPIQASVALTILGKKKQAVTLTACRKGDYIDLQVELQSKKPRTLRCLVRLILAKQPVFSTWLYELVEDLLKQKVRNPEMAQVAVSTFVEIMTKS